MSDKFINEFSNIFKEIYSDKLSDLVPDYKSVLVKSINIYDIKRSLFAFSSSGSFFIINNIDGSQLGNTFQTVEEAEKRIKNALFNNKLTKLLGE